MRAKIRGTEIYFDIEGAGLVPEGGRMVERPPAFIIHGGPGGDHSGFKPGFSYGATDDLGYHAVENRVSVHDVHATLLHLMGIDYQRFSYKFQGLDNRLTGVEPARVVSEILT